MKTCPLCKHTLTIERDSYWRCLSCGAYQRKARLWGKILLWRQDKGWIWRLVPLSLLVLIFTNLLRDPMFSGAGHWNPFGYFDLGFHELGHELFRPFGEFMRVAGGSLLQVLMPILWIIGFLQVRWYFASALCFGWLGSSLFGVAVYAGDAFVTKLPLVSLGNIGEEEAQGHDWEYLFQHTNNYRISTIDNTAQFLRISGTVFLILSILLCLALIILIARKKKSPELTPNPSKS